MSGAFNTIEGNLLLLGAVALEIADRDRDGHTRQRREQQDRAKVELNVQACCLWHWRER